MTGDSAKRLNDLVKLLDGLYGLHDELTGVIRGKIEAMKRADTEQMRCHGEREHALVEAIREREGLRRQLMDLVAKDIGLPARSARTISLRQLAARTPHPHREALEGAGDRLRVCMARVAAANRVASETARQVVGHLRWVFASVRPGDSRPMGYSQAGRLVAAAETSLLDAMG